VLKWIVLAAGALMSAAGFAWLWQGLGIVQVERGWSAVIAGAVIFAAGAVLMGLAALIRQIEIMGAGALAHASAKADFVSKSSPAFEPFDEPDLKAAPPEAPPERSGLKLEPPEQKKPELQEPEFKAPKAPELERDDPRPPAPLRPPPLKAPPSLPRASVPDFTSGKSLVGEANGARELEPEKPADNKLQPPNLQARRSQSLATDPSATAHWKSILSKANAGDGLARESGAAPAVISPVAPPSMPPAPVPPAETGFDGRIARRYESQGVRYSLYEDGSIEAETETGTFRFGSLVELRAFLDQRKG
jgi:hypothetical protein